MSDCVLWTGSRCGEYGWESGRAPIGGYAHIRVLERKLGRKLLPGMRALHTCDVKMCVNPDHLYEGTHSDNMRDMWSRVREPKISQDTVDEIRMVYGNRMATQEVLAEIYGISQSHVSDIVRERVRR